MPGAQSLSGLGDVGAAVVRPALPSPPLQQPTPPHHTLPPDHGRAPGIRIWSLVSSYIWILFSMHFGLAANSALLFIVVICVITMKRLQ